MSSHRRFAALRPSLLLGALLLALTAPAHAATITVTTTDVTSTTQCNLIDAITAANTDTAVNACTAGNGADTIELPASSTFTLTANNNTNGGGNGLPQINSVITINGNGSTITRSTAGGTPNFRILYIDTNGNLTLNRTTVSNGNAGTGISGGAIVNPSSTLTLNQCTISGNSAGASGGGIFTSGGTTTITNSTISGNTAGENGGGVLGTNYTITNSTISGNSSAGNGGGFYGNSSTISNSTVSGNTATGDGGGVLWSSSSLAINNSTLTGNTAANGGGIATGSRLTTLTLKNTLVAGNSATGTGREINRTSGTLTGNAYNLIGHSSETFAQAVNGTVRLGATDIVATSDNGTSATNTPTALTSILNTTLADNGGPTPTHALVAGSPAIDSGDPLFTDSTPTAGTSLRMDQRRYELTDGNTRRDIGAYELGGVDSLPAKPTNLVATTGDQQVSISFSYGAPGTKPISNYQFSVDDGPWIALSPAKTTSPVTITELTNGTTYAIKLRAVNANGDGAASDAVSVTPAVPVAVDGVCSTTVAASASAPSAGLCTSGTATAVSSTGGSWKWGCNGTGTGTTSTAANACASPYQTQTIMPLSANPTAILVNGTSTVTASSTSGLTPALTTSTGTICSVTGTTVTGTAAGLCTVVANLAISPDNCTSCYQAATQQSIGITVSKASQTINDISGSTTLNFGSTATVSTSADSGLAVSFGTSTPDVCSVAPVTVVTARSFVLKAASTQNSATVTPKTTGTCTVTANQAGDDSYDAAPQKTLAISINPVAPSAPTNLRATAGNASATIQFDAPVSNGGAALYNYEYQRNADSPWTPFTPVMTASPVQINGLSNGTTYSIKLRAISSAEVDPGAESAAVSVKPRASGGGGGGGGGGGSTPPPAPDADTDGIDSSVEDAVPSAVPGSSLSGDGNGDGIADSTQASVSSFPDDSGVYTTLVSSSGKPLKDTQPAAVPADFPSETGTVLQGVRFTLTGTTAGATETIELYLPVSADDIGGVLKKNLRTGNWDTLPATVTTVGTKAKVVYSLTDGGDYDSDRSANGSISDPVYVVGKAATPPAPVPASNGGGSFGWLTLIPLMAAARRRRKH